MSKGSKSEKVQESLARGRQLHHAGQMDGARALYLEVLQLDPENADALSLLGTIDAQTGNLPDAERLLAKAVQLEPERASFHNNLANIYQAAGKFEEALNSYRKVLALNDELPELHNNVGNLLLRLKRPAQAELAFRNALKLNPEHPTFHNNLGRALNNQSKLDEALITFKKATELDSESAQAFNNLGHVYHQLGKLALAAAAFSTAADKDMKFSAPRRNLGLVLAKQNFPEQAIRQFRSAIELDGSDPGPYIDLGATLHGVGRISEAIEAYRAALRVNPNSARAMIGLAVACAETGDFGMAEKLLIRSLNIDDTDGDSWAQLSSVYSDLGLLEKAREVVTTGLKSCPDHGRLIYMKAQLARISGSPERALKDLGSLDIMELDPRLAQEVRYELSAIYDLQDDPSMAFLHAGEANLLLANGWSARNIDRTLVLNQIDTMIQWMSESAPELHSDRDGSEMDNNLNFVFGFPGAGITALANEIARARICRILRSDSIQNFILTELTSDHRTLAEGLRSVSWDEVKKYRQLYDPLVQAGEGRRQTVSALDFSVSNALNLPLLLRLFPNAKFIYLRRNPVDTILAAYMQNYAVNHITIHLLQVDWTIELYGKVQEMISAFLEQFSERIIAVDFEHLVDNIGGSIEQIRSFLGLDSEREFLEKGGKIDTGRVDILLRAGAFSSLSANNRQSRQDRYKRQLRPYQHLLATKCAASGDLSGNS